MLAKFERRSFAEGCRVWVGKYRGLSNLPHWHFENELIACRAGEALITLDGEQVRTGGGDCVFCPGESIHSVTGSPDSRLIVAQYDAALCPGTAQLRPRAQLFADRYGAYERMDGIFREEQDRRPFYAEKMNAAMAELVVDLFRGEELERVPGEEFKTMDRYKELLGVIDRSFDELSFRDAAAYMNMSEAYFSRFFKRASGMTFSRYLNAVRIGKAIEILRAEPDITMAALMAECGFNTLRNFNRVFKEVTGCAPSQLPANFVLNLRSLATDQDGFDPTMDSSELLR